MLHSEGRVEEILGYTCSVCCTQQVHPADPARQGKGGGGKLNYRAVGILCAHFLFQGQCTGPTHGPSTQTHVSEFISSLNFTFSSVSGNHVKI